MPTAWLTSATFFDRRRGAVRAAYEHPAVVRLAHWLNAVSVLVMAGSGLQILRAFPAFGPKLPPHDLLTVPPALSLGGWLAGGLRWHFTFMWIFTGTAVLYVIVQVLTGRVRMVLIRPRDLPGVWPMARHYFLFGPRPPLTEPYNPLQKLAYTSTLAFGAVSVLTGLVLFKPAQLSPLAFIFGGYRAARVWHFAAMCGLLAFIPGHLLMVALHGWDNFAGMFTGWKRNPEYLSGPESTPVPSALAAGAQPAPEGEEPEEASTELAPSREETDGDD